VVPARDAQDRLVGACIELARHFGWRRVGQLVGLVQLGLQRHGAGRLGIGNGIETQGHAIGNRAQCLGVHEAAQTRDHVLGHVMPARQFGQRIAGDGGRRGAARFHLGAAQGGAQQKGVELAAVIQVQLLLAGLHLVRRRLREVDAAALYHVSVLRAERDIRVEVGLGRVWPTLAPSAPG
jgi:hypothetical protein